MNHYLPASLDVDALITKNPPTGFREPFKKQKLIHILHLIYEKSVLNPWNITEEGFTPLNAAILQRRIHNYTDYIRYLKDNRIIQCDGRYIIGAKPKGYRFCESVLTGKYRIEVLTDCRLIRNIQREAKSRKWRKRYNYLYRFFNHKLEIDELAAIGLLNKLNPYSNPIISVTDCDDRIYPIKRIKDHKFFFSVDTTGHRLHTNLTNLKSDLRQFLTYDGQSLVEIDVSNCQPYLSLVFFNPEFYNKDSAFSIYRIISRNRRGGRLDNAKTFSKKFSQIKKEVIPKNGGTHTDIQHYTELVEKGTLYEYWVDAVAKHLSETENTTEKEVRDLYARHDAKEDMFSIFFTGNQYLGDREHTPKKLFKQMFPHVYKVFSIIKRKNKAQLAILLQSIESYLMLDIVCKRIAEERPDLSIFTIHDSIQTTKGNENYVYAILTEELKKHINHQPKLKIKR